MAARSIPPPGFLEREKSRTSLISSPSSLPSLVSSPLSRSSSVFTPIAEQGGLTFRRGSYSPLMLLSPFSPSESAFSPIAISPSQASEGRQKLHPHDEEVSWCDGASLTKRDQHTLMLLVDLFFASRNSSTALKSSIPFHTRLILPITISGFGI